jgi:hypothetical protein
VWGDGFGDGGESVEEGVSGGRRANIYASNSDIAGWGDVDIKEDCHGAIFREGKAVHNSTGVAVSDVDEDTRRFVFVGEIEGREAWDLDGQAGAGVEVGLTQGKDGCVWGEGESGFNLGFVFEE